MFVNVKFYKDSNVLSFSVDNFRAAVENTVQYFDDMDNVDLLAIALFNRLYRDSIALYNKPGNAEYIDDINMSSDEKSFTVRTQYAASFLSALRQQSYAYCKKNFGVTLMQKDAPSYNAALLFNAAGKSVDIFQYQRKQEGDQPRRSNKSAAVAALEKSIRDAEKLLSTDTTGFLAQYIAAQKAALAQEIERAAAAAKKEEEDRAAAAAYLKELNAKRRELEKQIAAAEKLLSTDTTGFLAQYIAAQKAALAAL